MKKVYSIRTTYRMQHMSYILATLIVFWMLIYLAFFHLALLPIEEFDEARHGINAVEMLHSRQYIGTTFQYQTDYWNLKPILSEYGIILGIKIFGFNLFGIRFYSALAMLLSGIVGFVYALKKFGKREAVYVLLGFCACMPLWKTHSGRNADADSLYCFWIFLFVILLCESMKRRWIIYLSFMCLGFAFLCKSFHVIPYVIMGCLTIIIYWKKLSFKAYNLCFAIISGLFPIAIWAGMRFRYDGLEFFKRMISNDLLYRGTNDIEGHSGSIIFYLKYFLADYGLFLSILLVFGSLYLLRKKIFENEKYIILGSGILIPLILFSIAKTKISWYIFPTFPIVILLGANAWKDIRENIRDRKADRVMGLLICGILFSTSLLNCYEINKMCAQSELSCDQEMKQVFDRAVCSNKNIYILNHDENGIQKEDWLQSEILAAELYGDFVTQSGGYSAFEQDSKGYLWIEKQFQNELHEGDVILQESERYYLVGH